MPPSSLPPTHNLCQQVPFVPSPCRVTVPPMSVSGLEQFLNALDNQATQSPTSISLIAPHLSQAARRSHPNHPPVGIWIPKPNQKCDKSSGLSIISRMDSVPLPGEAIPAARLNDVLRKELAGNTLDTNSNFLDRSLPCERLPFPIDEDTLKTLSTPIGGNDPIWNEARTSFSQPPKDFRESTICNWLNNIGMTMRLIYGHRCERLWWTGNCASGPPRIPAIWKPALVLIDHSYYDRSSQKDFPGAEWAFVKALGEVQQSPHMWLTDTIAAKSYLTFLFQPHRRFTISLSFINTEKSQFAITVTDRAGQIRANKVDLIGFSTDNSLLLLSVLVFLMFGSSEDIGLDPHFEMDASGGRVIAIECENRRFEVVQRIHALQPLYGQGTQVWIVTHNGRQCILKDSWVWEDCIHNEVAHLHRMKDHKDLDGRVPTMICGGDIVINGVKDSTWCYRNARSFHRIHRRIVTSPVGESITSFKSKKEFIRAMISIIESKSMYSWLE